MAIKALGPVLEPYERRARLAPGLLIVAPFVDWAVAFGLTKYPVVSGLLGLISLGIGGFILAHYVGNIGRATEGSLYAEWGGKPTTQLLRAVGGDSTNRKLRREAAEKLTGLKLFSPRAERRDQAKSDEVIDAAVAQLRGITRRPDFPLVEKELAQYGFERNLYGTRWIGRSIGYLSLAGFALGFFLLPEHYSVSSVVGALICLAIVLFWSFGPSVEKTRLAAFRYATQLLDAAVTISRAARS